MEMKLIFRDANQKVIGTEQKYSSGNVKSASISHQLGASVPAGTKTVSISGSFKCRWATSVVAEETVAVSVELKVEQTQAAVLPIVPSSKPTTAPNATAAPAQTPKSTQAPSSSATDKTTKQETKGDVPLSGGSPWEHTGPLETLAISIIAAIAAVLGGAGGSAAGTAAGALSGDKGGGDEEDAPPYAEAETKPYPPIDTANVPDYPATTKGSKGEIISKKPDGTIEAEYPNGNLVTRFPNGTVQVRLPDGYVWEEWPDGTVSASENGVFVTKTPDGTVTQVENGEETVFNPDGTSVETNSKGVKIKRNESGEVVSSERDGFIATRHPEDPDAQILTSPYGGSVVIREKEKTELVMNPNGKWEQSTEYETVLEGEIKTENATHIYRPDGSKEIRGDDGTVYVEDANGSIKATLSDGTDLNYNAETGEVDYKSSDGSYVKGNGSTGELDAKMSDGSFWKRDAKGNGSFDDKEKGLKGVCSEDGAFKTESKDGSITQQADGTIKAQTKDGTALIEKADGTVTVVDKDGTSLTRNPDGTGFMRKADGTVSPLPPLPR
jgi:hypothetical protein